MYVCMYVVYLKLPIQECLHKMCAAAKKFKRVCMKPLKKYALSKIKRLKIKNDNKNYANNFRFLRTLIPHLSFPCFWIFKLCLSYIVTGYLGRLSQSLALLC